MKKVRYIGRHDAVDLELPSGEEITVEHKKTIDVDDDFALRLVEQEENWEPSGWKLPAPEPEAAAADTASDQPDEAAGVKE